MENLPIYISIVFALTTLITVWFFYKASNNSKQTLILLIAWLLIQAVIAISGFYSVTDTIPPRFLLLVLPPLLFIAGLFTTTNGKKYIDSLDPTYLTILHIVRIPVEIVLFWLFIHNVVPELMTFEGHNFDILSGITAPLIAYYGFIKMKLSKNVILIWNFVCLALLLNIVFNAAISAPSPIQRFAFEQPNIAVLYFPFIWLPACIVPLVLLSHLASIRQLIKC